MKQLRQFLQILFTLLILGQHFTYAQQDRKKTLQDVYSLRQADAMDSLYQLIVKHTKKIDQKSPEFDHARAYIAMALIWENNIPKAEQYISSLQTDYLKGSKYFSVARVFRQTKRPAYAEHYGLLAIESAKKFLDQDLHNLEDGSQPASVIASTSMLLAGVYRDQGQFDKATDLLAKTIPLTSEKNGLGLLQTKADIHMQSKAYDKALAIYLELMKKGNETAALIQKIKSAYENTNQANDFETFIQKIIADHRQSFRDNLQANLIKIEAPDFKLKDVNGQTVSLSDLKGKIVVLDFWAMWCAPCKASFPAMQMAIDHYKNNPDIAFLFIDTYENGNDMTQQAAHYMKQHQYSFDVLFDQTTNGKDYKVAQDYAVKSLPEKIIIDKQGYIRYRLTGFSGNDETTVQEISYIINLLQTE